MARIALVQCDEGTREDSPVYRELWEMLSSLLSVSGTAVREGAKRATDWKHTFSFETDTGGWLALAQRWEDYADDKAPVGYYKDCLALRLGAGDRVEAVAKVASLTDHNRLGIVDFSNPTVMVGRGTLGKLQSRLSR